MMSLWIMRHSLTLKSAALTLLVAFIASPAAAQSRAPNVVLIYADDLGYGDVSAYSRRAA